MTVGLQKPLRDCFVVVMETVLRRETSEEMQYFHIKLRITVSFLDSPSSKNISDSLFRQR